MRFKSDLSTLPLIAIQAKASNAWTFGTPRSALALLNDSPIMFDTPLTRMLREHQRMIDQAFFDVPEMRDMSKWNVNDMVRYEIMSNDDHEFKVAIDVPGMDADDILVTLENDNKVLKVSGSRESKGDGYSFSSKFSQSFNIDPNVNIDKFSAQMDKGVLIIAAPKDLKRLENSTRKIPIKSSATESVASVNDTSALHFESSAKKVDVVEKKEAVAHH